MKANAWGRLVAALVVVSSTAPLANAASLSVSRIDNGRELARFALSEGESWCILWNHSVQGFEVADCYENRGGTMVLVKSHQPDFAAGLGEIPGRGHQVSDGKGGYWILAIDEPVSGNAYVLRPGRQSTVDHRIAIAGRTVSLSKLAEHDRVKISLETEHRQ